MHGEEYGGRREGTHKRKLFGVKYGGRWEGTHKGICFGGEVRRTAGKKS